MSNVQLQTLTPTEAADPGRIWDAVVLGAGPAGSVAARMLALRGMKVLLLDKATFPRSKVCGCCLNASALGTLEACGLPSLLADLNARALDHMRFYCGGESALIALPRNKVVSRDAFDVALLRSAISAGASFLAETSATSTSIHNGIRSVAVHVNLALHTLSARAVLVATGLASKLLDGMADMRSVVAPHSRIGIGVQVPQAPEFYTDSTIFMACGTGGYAGLVRLEDGRLNIAGALDLDFLREHANPGRAVAHLLKRCGLPTISGLEHLHWHGTPLLTRKRERVAAERLLVLGDSAGYVEPFTGEGMAWAMLSGQLAAQLVPAKNEIWSTALERAWTQTHRHEIQKRQFSCRVIARILRSPRCSRAVAGVLEALPVLARIVQA